MDEVVGNITDEIKARGMWARTLLVRRETLSNVPFCCIQAAYKFPEADVPLRFYLMTRVQVWSSDNGGAVHLGGGANNHPLRGGYYNK